MTFCVSTIRRSRQLWRQVELSQNQSNLTLRTLLDRMALPKPPFEPTAHPATEAKGQVGFLILTKAHALRARDRGASEGLRTGTGAGFPYRRRRRRSMRSTWRNQPKGGYLFPGLLPPWAAKAAPGAALRAHLAGPSRASRCQGCPRRS